MQTGLVTAFQSSLTMFGDEELPLPDHWGTKEDFATLFKYFWYRDFPMDKSAIGARRTDWTIHVGLVVRSIGDFMGLATRFERGGRKDAVLRSLEGDEIAVEWEWQGIWGQNELKKLRAHKVWSPSKDVHKSLRYGVLITYTHTPNIDRVYERVRLEWAEACWPLLLVLIDLEETKKFPSGKDFKNINFSVFDSTGQKILGSVPALPWNVESTRWSIQAF